MPRRLPKGSGSTQKCTEQVAPSSGSPTDLRRSGCLSELHQPQVLLTRCNWETRRSRARCQPVDNRICANCAFFILRSTILQAVAPALHTAPKKMRRAWELSSTPDRRSACAVRLPGASSYSLPSSAQRQSTLPPGGVQALVERLSRNLRRTDVT